MWHLMISPSQRVSFVFFFSKSFVEAMMKRSRKIVTVPEEEHGMTALHFTALYNNVEITKLLLQSVSNNFVVL